MNLLKANKVSTAKARNKSKKQSFTTLLATAGSANTTTTTNLTGTINTWTATTTTVPNTGGLYLSPGIYGSTTTYPVYQYPVSRVTVLGQEFELLAQTDPAALASLVGFLGIGYYIHLKESGFNLSVLPKELVDHLDTLAIQHQRGERIKKALDGHGDA